MTLQTFVWRPRAKIVAVIDLTLSAIGFVVVIVFAILAAFAVAFVSIIGKVSENSGGNGGTGGDASQDNNKGGGNKISPNEVHTWALWILWVGVAADAALTLAQVWASYKLLKSTELRKTPSEALSGARFWLYLTLILLLIRTPLVMVIFGMYILGALKLIATAACLFVVFQFTDELKVAVNAQTISRVAPL